MCQMSRFFFFFNEFAEIVNGGSVITGPTRSSYEDSSLISTVVNIHPPGLDIAAGAIIFLISNKNAKVHAVNKFSRLRECMGRKTKNTLVKETGAEVEHVEVEETPVEVFVREESIEEDTAVELAVVKETGAEVEAVDIEDTPVTAFVREESREEVTEVEETVFEELVVEEYNEKDTDEDETPV